MDIYTFSFVAMGGTCEIRLAAENGAIASSIAKEAIGEVNRIEQKYSRYRPDSIISQINAAAGSGCMIECDAETNWLLDYANKLHQTSHGLFDITSGILRQAWNFKEPRIPADDELKELTRLIGWQKVQRDNSRVYLPEPRMEIDFGGFGKEYAADRAAAVLKAKGINHGYANLGGDISVVGPRTDGQPWLIGIQDPRRKGQIVATIPLRSGGLATSGDYEKYFILDGRHYCHILNPRSGKPVGFWRSVTVITPMALVAGSCSTIAMLSESEALDFLDSTGFQYLAIDQQGKITKQDRASHANA